MIQTITKYIFRKEEYNSLQEVQEAIHNTIGEEVIDKIKKTCEIRHKDLFKLLEILCSKEVREVLTDCYSATYLEPDDNENINEIIYTPINILDVKF